MNKKEFRLMAKARLSALDSKEKNRYSKKISSNLYELLKESQKIWKGCEQEKVLGCFAPFIKEEPLWNQGFKANIGFGASFSYAYPFESLRSKNEMEYALSKGLESLVFGHHFGVDMRVPRDQSRPVRPHVLLVPGLLFTLEGDRLGRGAGCYDRYMANFLGPKIGVCFECQLIEELPISAHDQSVDFIVSENGIEQCNNAL